MKRPILFLRGLNTYGEDRLRFGLWRGPQMHRGICQKLSRLGLEAQPVLGMGKGSLEEHTQKALAFIKQIDSKILEGGVHLLGHSAGGLVARALACILGDKVVLSVTTMAAPHLGSVLAELVGELPTRRPWAYWALKTLGYDLNERLQMFREIHPTRVQDFLARYPTPPGVKTASLIYALPHSQMSWPIRWMQELVDPDGRLPLSDGFVSLESQRFGKILGQFPADHLHQLQGIGLEVTVPFLKGAESNFIVFDSAPFKKGTVT